LLNLQVDFDMMFKGIFINNISHTNHTYHMNHTNTFKFLLAL